MTKPIARDPIHRRRVFDADVIEMCVRWYITYRLSYRDLIEMMAERGIQVAHTTVLRWVTRYVPEFEKRWRRFSKVVGTSWRVALSVPLCSAISRSRQRGRQQIFMMQTAEHRSGAHAEALGDPMAGWLYRSRHDLRWRVRHAWTERHVRACVVVMTHP